VRYLILDTNILINHWHRSRVGPLASKTVADAESGASKLIGIYQTAVIVTPVYLEFVGGVHNAHELRLARAYLNSFRLLDAGKITAEDWNEARRLAERIPRDSKPRHLGDCLIKAIAIRFRCEVESPDLGMPL
jgi:predicted nucleic acid-binding protein